MDIRNLKPEEYEKAQEMIRERLPWAEMPPLEVLYGKLAKGEMKGTFGLQNLFIIEPFVAEPAHVRDMIMWIDGALSGQKAYSFFVDDRCDKFKKLVVKHFSDVVEGFHGTLFTRDRG